MGVLALLFQSPRLKAQTFDQIQFVIGTGGDDLRGDSSAMAKLLAANGSTLQEITLKGQNQPGWNNNTSHTVTATLSPALAASKIAHIVITLTSHNGFLETDDNWNVETVVVTLSNGGSGPLEIINVAGDPFVRLTGSQPSVTLTPLPTGPPGTFNEIQFVITTGGDDLRGDSSATATLLAPNGSTPQVITLKSQSQSGWGNNSTHTVTHSLKSPLALFAISDIVITLTSHNGLLETDDNWNVQDVVVNLSNNGSGSNRILHAFGDPIARLTGSIPSVSFPLPTDLLGPVCPSQSRNCTDVLTYHNDSMRTGWNSSEKVLTTANVKPPSFGHIATILLDDQVDAQPLVVGGVTFVATENNTIYALDFWTGSSVIHHFGPPVQTPLGCNNNGPNVGINGTPVIDLATSTLYVDTYLLENGNPTHQIHALDLANLIDRAHSPVTVAASHPMQSGGNFMFNAKYQRQRPGLLLQNGNVYAGYGSFCDFGGNNSRGWLLGWNQTTLAPLSADQLNDRRTSGGGLFLSSVWMSGYGVAADNEKSLYFITGNSSSGTYNSTFNIAESAVKISADLSSITSFFTPANVNALDSKDTDYGSGGIMLLPDLPGSFSHLAVGAGKDGRMFVFNRDNLTGFRPTDIPSNVQVGGCWCGPSYFNTGTPKLPAHRVVSSGGNTLMTWSPGVTSGGTPVPTLNLVASSVLSFETAQDPGFFTSISSDDLTTNSAIIWAVGRAEGSDQHVTLYAYDAVPSGTSLPLLWSGTAGFWPNTGGNANIVPTVANGRVFVASNQRLEIFGLTRSPRPPRPPFPIGGLHALAQPIPGAAYWGTVKSVSGNRLTLELRDGSQLLVDISSALSQGQTGE
ncbi:MAG: PQQ-binding-like beta-propeller repeat protein, partial [Candidatus Acidiferrales bacterium]